MTNRADMDSHIWDRRSGWMHLVGEGFPEGIKSLVERPFAGLTIYVFALLGTFLVIERCFSAALAMPFSAYASPSITLAAFEYFGWTSRILLLAFAGVVLLMDPGRLRWSGFSGGGVLRWVVGFLAATMVWPLTTYGYNYAADAGHLLDRGLLAATFLLLLWRPLFILPFLLLAYLLLAQLTAPSLGGSVLPHKTQVLRALELFAAFYFFRVVTGYHRTNGFVFLLGCYVATAYWLPAWAKLQFDWLSSNQLELIPLAAYAHGWRGEQPPQSLVQLGDTLRSFAPALKAGALIIEAGFVLLFVRYRITVFLLCMAIGFHLGVFYLFGFLFWTWIALDMALIGLLIYAHRSSHGSDFYGLKYLPLAATLILTGAYWAKPPALAWYDTALTYAYNFVATLDSGNTVDLNAKFFAPYEDAFTMMGFGYLVQEHGVLVGPYGSTHDTVLYEELHGAGTPQAILELEKIRPALMYDERRANRFYQFVEQFVTARNRHGDRQKLLYSLHPPRQFWSNDEGMSFLGDNQIRSVTLVEKTRFYDGETLHLVRELPVHTFFFGKAQ